MQGVRTVAQESAEDVFFGQVVIIWARWFIIACGVALILTTAEEPDELTAAVIPVVLLMAMNFFLHGRYFLEKPVNAPLIMLTSLLDLVIITLIVMFWPDERGLANPFFVFYYPLVLAFAFVMPRRIEAAYTVLAVAAYVGACFLAEAMFSFDETRSGLLELNSQNLETLVLRLIPLAAVGGLGNYYFRIQRRRRRPAMGGPT